ncbi:MAG: ATP-binding protein [candidate division Zixibacteria bacterium]
MNTLIVTVGLPRSGKSTWAKEVTKQIHSPIVNPDAVRLAVTGQRFVKTAEPLVWTIVQIMVRALFEAGHNSVILDATNTTKARRKFWLDECRNGFYGDDAKVSFVVFDTPVDVCKQRAIHSGQKDLLPIIDSMDAGFESLDPITEPNHGVQDVFAGIMGLL